MSTSNGKEPTGNTDLLLDVRAPFNLIRFNMNINELLSSGANVAITITPTELKEFAMYLIDETLSAKEQVPEPERYLTPDETAKMLEVSKNTLWRWDKESYLSPVKIGRKSRYKLSDVNTLLVGQPQRKKPATGLVTGKFGEDLS